MTLKYIQKSSKHQAYIEMAKLKKFKELFWRDAHLEQN